MTFSEFITKKPVLYGQIMHKGKSKIGSFHVQWQSISNSTIYMYFSPAGKRQKNAGFTLMRAFNLFNSGKLSTDPELGKPDNYL